MGCGHAEHDKLSTIEWIAAMRPTLVEAFKYYSNQEIDQYLATLAAARELEKDRAAKRVYEAKRELSLSSEIRTCITTLSIDQKKTWREGVKKVKEMILFILSKNPSFLNDAIITAEFHSGRAEAHDTEAGWNPHIHIFSYLPEKMTPGTLAQRMRKLMKKYIWSPFTQDDPERLIYKVHCKQGTQSTQADYLVSLKKESKREHQEKDKITRKENEILDYYIM